MSKLIPRETIDVLRQHINIGMDMLGIECTLYIPNDASLENAEGLDMYEVASRDLTFVSYSTQCFIEWNPNKYRLRKLGIYVEDELPILVWVPLLVTALEGTEVGTEVEVDTVHRSYLSIAPEFVPADVTAVQEFEIVDVIVKGTHDAVVLKGMKCVPRRVQLFDPT